MTGRQTPSQTVGPFFSYGLAPTQYAHRQLSSAAGPDLVSEGTAGERIRLVGQVFDGAGELVRDALIEIWQADAAGRHRQSADDRAGNNAFAGFGRCGTGADPEARFIFSTVKPGATADGGAPHITLIVFMRGLLQHVYTRAYFSDETEANAVDPVLRSVPDERRDTLVARRKETPDGVIYRFDVHMQGERETVFFDV